MKTLNKLSFFFIAWVGMCGTSFAQKTLPPEEYKFKGNVEEVVVKLLQ